ncbi:ATP-grasp fold amidoligase family protein [Xenorhabdus bovienii]|uniref:ATP-grasp fold amidoligase family protein n=1 Tax=Xenorhabdus bovienii TaxID=40576 RepID=UPI002157F79B|nr:ATP-grasp fold amidoligase family protein [Xenorhabdus bovienii]
MQFSIKKIRRKILYHLCEYYPEFVTKLLFYRRFGKKLNLGNPITFNEKLQWLKLKEYKDNSLVTLCADKYAAREYIIKSGCSDILNEIYYVWNNTDKINWDSLPNKFVLKCNHGAGYNIICKDKNELNISNAKYKLEKWMKHDYWRNSVELCYKNITKQIICEKFIETSTGSLPYDYKVFCFNGKPLFVMLCTERETDKPKYYFMDKEWNILPYGLDYLELKDKSSLKKPDGYEKLFHYAKKLSTPFPFVRVDFYLNDGKIIFGELTFTPAAGLDIELNNPKTINADEIIGDLLDLNKISHEYQKRNTK